MEKKCMRASGAAVFSAAWSRRRRVGAALAFIISPVLVAATAFMPLPPAFSAHATTPSLDAYTARPPIHTLAGTTAGPAGLFPSQIKKAYGLPAKGGAGTIAIIAAFDHPNIESDLAAFDKEFSLAACTAKNACLEVHRMSASEKQDSGWSLETALDTEWAHAIAPSAQILVVEAASDSGTSLLKAVDYARGRRGVVAVSMSWGGGEFADEGSLDGHFESSTSLAFFASSGDDGTGVSWPAASPGVIAVGGTSLSLGPSSKAVSEKAWSGSGGGTSAYETEPIYQKGYSIPRSGGMRAIPDVAYAADPVHGFSVYHAPDGTGAAKGAKGWYVVGGTSAGAPQWAAITALAAGAHDPVFLAKLYGDKASPSYASYFRDIVSGTNGGCGYYCAARKRYDYVTGLGSPLTYKF